MSHDPKIAVLALHSYTRKWTVLPLDTGSEPREIQHQQGYHVKVNRRMIDIEIAERYIDYESDPRAVELSFYCFYPQIILENSDLMKELNQGGWPVLVNGLRLVESMRNDTRGAFAAAHLVYVGDY